MIGGVNDDGGGMADTQTSINEGLTSAPSPLAGRPGSEDFAVVWKEIQRLGLEPHVAELEAVGYTIIPPDRLAPPEFVTRIRDALVATAERRSGSKLDLDAGAQPDAQPAVPWDPFTFMLFEDPVFSEAVLNPVPLALADYAVGRSCMLSTCIGLVKGPGAAPMGLHTDNKALGIPSPYPAYPLLLNCTWLLTDYTKSGGALCLVPGSQSYGRGPGAGEGAEEVVAVEAPAGSMVVWSGSIWHGSFPRTIPGIRLTLVTIYTRPFVIPQERYREEVTPELLQQNLPRFAELMGKNLYQYCFKEEGYDFNKVVRTPGNSWWD